MFLHAMPTLVCGQLSSDWHCLVKSLLGNHSPNLSFTLCAGCCTSHQSPDYRDLAPLVRLHAIDAQIEVPGAAASPACTARSETGTAVPQQRYQQQASQHRYIALHRRCIWQALENGQVLAPRSLHKQHPIAHKNRSVDPDPVVLCSC